MSTNYSVGVVLKVSYEGDNIKRILTRGSVLGFKYHDHEFAKAYASAPIIGVDAAIQKIIHYDVTSGDGAPSVYVTHENGGFFLWCFKSKDGQLSPHIGGASNPKEKDDHFDFAYYIRLLLDLCDDFAIESLETDIF